MARDVDIVRAIERAPMRTLRLKDVDGGANTWRAVHRLVDRGAIKRLTHGFYTVPLDGRDARTWQPPLEDSALAVATARFGAREVAMMGLTAARHWAAVPRAIGTATIAVPRPGYAPIELETGGTIRFVPRELERLHLVLERTAFGEGLITTPTQTLFDLLARAALGVQAAETRGAVSNLLPQADAAEFKEIMSRHRRLNAQIRMMEIELEDRHAAG